MSPWSVGQINFGGSTPAVNDPTDLLPGTPYPTDVIFSFHFPYATDLSTYFSTVDFTRVAIDATKGAYATQPSFQIVLNWLTNIPNIGTSTTIVLKYWDAGCTAGTGALASLDDPSGPGVFQGGYFPQFDVAQLLYNRTTGILNSFSFYVLDTSSNWGYIAVKRVGTAHKIYVAEDGDATIYTDNDTATGTLNATGTSSGGYDMKIIVPPATTNPLYIQSVVAWDVALSDAEVSAFFTDIGWS